MKRNKQCGSDDTPAEFLQAISLLGSAAADWLMELFDSIWTRKEVPHTWHVAMKLHCNTKVLFILCSICSTQRQ